MSAPRERRARLPLPIVAAGLSGAAALVYEVLWVRRLGEVTGSTAIAVYLVLGVFFLGLGVGARLGGRIADRFSGHIGVFVGMELVVASSALLFMPFLHLLEHAYSSLAPAEWPLAAAIAIRGLVALLALVVPTLAMGGTIPALVRHVATGGGELASRIGWLYGVNTLGGALGVGVAVFVLFPRLGVTAIALTGAALNGTAVLAALAGRLTAGARAAGDARPASGRTDSARDPSRARGNASRRALLATAALMGLASVGFEILWTRALGQRFLSTVYSFATILLVYLACLAVGALLTPLLARARLVRATTLAIVVALAGIASLGSLVLLGLVPGDLAYAADPASSFLERQRFELLTAVGVMAMPLLAFGVAFPMIAALTRREHEHTGGDVGSVYLANTAGAVSAPVSVGLLALPSLGLERSILALGWLLVLCGVALLVAWRRARRGHVVITLPAVLVASIVLTAAAPKDIRLYKHGSDDTLVEYVEGISSSIAVVREPDGNLFLKIDNSYRLGDARTRFAQQRQGLLPLLLHPEPHAALFIGMGTGSSAGAAAAYGGVAVDVLEIVPELIDLLPHFAAINEDLHARASVDDSVRLLGVDARHFVRTTRRRYDVVVGDLFVPWRAGEGSMYTREHLTAVRDVLADGGIFCQWLPLYQLRPDEVCTIAATMLEVFPHVEAYWLYFNTVQPCIGLLGSREAIDVDAGPLAARLFEPARRRLLVEAGYPGVREVLGGWIARRGALAEWSRDAPVETRDRPLIEFLAPMRELEQRPFHARTNVREMLALTHPEEIGGPLAELEGAERRAVERYRTGIAHYLTGQLDAREPGHSASALARYAAAYMEIPDVLFVRLVLVDALQQAIAAGRFDAARPGIQALIRVRETAYMGHYLDARIALIEEDPSRARSALRAALRADPEHDASWELLREIEARWPELEADEPEGYNVEP